MEKMVPMETLTPMLVEPSSGSYISTYLPPRRSSRTCTGIGCSSSSDATTHTRPVCSTACRTVSLANTSSFCCTSPWTLIAPNSPRMSVSPARRTWREMILAARQRSYSRLESSPVASGCSRSCSMMKRSIVMTDVGECTRPLAGNGEGDRTPLIRPEHRDATSLEARHHLGRGMTVPIVRAHADHRILRPQLVEPAVRRSPARTVMPHLEQRHVPNRAGNVRFRRQAGIAGEQQARRPIRHEEDDRLLVDIRLTDRPGGIWAQHLERHAVELEPITTARRPPLGAVCFDGAEESQVIRVRHRFSRLEHVRRVERLEDRGQPAEVVEVRVRRDDDGELRRAVTPQERHHYPAPRIAKRRRSARSAVDQEPAPSRRPQRDRVPLTDVQETYGEATAI